MSKKTVKKTRIRSKGKPLVSVIMGSKNDLPVMRPATEALKEFRIPYEVQIVSAHRTPEFMYEFASLAKNRGVQVIIAGAGGAAHLPGMVASLTSLPVIGVPIMVGKLGGLDALLSVAQMPKGVPVACVAVDNAYNAGLLAARILSVHDKKLQAALDEFRRKKRVQVLSGNRRLKKG